MKKAIMYLLCVALLFSSCEKEKGTLRVNYGAQGGTYYTSLHGKNGFVASEISLAESVTFTSLEEGIYTLNSVSQTKEKIMTAKNTIRIYSGYNEMDVSFEDEKEDLVIRINTSESLNGMKILLTVATADGIITEKEKTVEDFNFITLSEISEGSLYIRCSIMRGEVLIESSEETIYFDGSKEVIFDFTHLVLTEDYALIRIEDSSSSPLSFSIAVKDFDKDKASITLGIDFSTYIDLGSLEYSWYVNGLLYSNDETIEISASLGVRIDALLSSSLIGSLGSSCIIMLTE